MVYVIIATTLVCVLFDPVIPTSSFNFTKMFLYLYYMYLQQLSLWHLKAPMQWYILWTFGDAIKSLLQNFNDLTDHQMALESSMINNENIYQLSGRSSQTFITVDIGWIAYSLKDLKHYIIENIAIL